MQIQESQEKDQIKRILQIALAEVWTHKFSKHQISQEVRNQNRFYKGVVSGNQDIAELITNYRKDIKNNSAGFQIFSQNPLYFNRVIYLKDYTNLTLAKKILQSLPVESIPQFLDQIHELEYNNNNEFLSNRFESWVQFLQDDAPISSVLIPGTHSSSAFVSQFDQFLYFFRSQFLTQSLDIMQQLSDGVRFFNTTVKVQTKLDQVKSRTGDFLHLLLQTILGRFVSFLTLHPKQFIILNIKQQENKIFDLWGLLQSSQKEYWKFIFTSQDSDNVLPKVKDLRGKIWILFDETPAYNSSNGQSITVQKAQVTEPVEKCQNKPISEGYDPFINSLKLWVQDLNQIYEHKNKWGQTIYSIQNSLGLSNQEKISQVLDLLTRPNDGLKLNFLNQQAKSSMNASYINTQFMARLSNLGIKDKLGGIVIADYMTKQMCRQIIRKNNLTRKK